MDIRSLGGYVVGPGSVVPLGEYKIECDMPLADVPEWLVQKLGAFTKREQPENVSVPDAPHAVTARAGAWLAGQLGAVQGEGGDAHTFKVICGLRDQGVSAVQAFNLLANLWNERCAPQWDHAELQVKVDNAYRYAQNTAGARAALPDDFPIIDADTLRLSAPLLPKKEVAHAQRLVDFASSQAKGPGYLVKGVLQRRTYAELYGAPGEGKTFVALDMAYHVAAGADWMGRKVHAGPVLYLAYEGTGGLVKRAQALRQKYGAADVPLYIAGAAFNLREPSGRKDLAATLAALPAKPVLIVIDTFARALMGGDENSAQDVGAFNSSVAALIESTGACVMIVHHSGKNKAAGARGSSALLGALDTELEVDNGQVLAKKQRDVEAGDPIGFTLKPLVVGIDEDGDEMTSCVVEPATVAAAAGSTRLSGHAQRGFDVLCEMAPDNAPVSELKWRVKCGDFLDAKSEKQRFFDLKKKLRAAGVIEVSNTGMVTRRLE